MMTETSYTSLRQNLAAVLDRVAEGREIELRRNTDWYIGSSGTGSIPCRRGITIRMWSVRIPPELVLGSQLFVPQRLNRIQPCGFDRGQHATDDSYEAKNRG